MDPTESSPVSGRESLESSANSAMNTSPPFSSDGTDQKLDAAGSSDSNCSYPVASGSMEEADSTSNRRSYRAVPDEQKDEAYWEKRRKINEAGKISRDYRRMLEAVVEQQAFLLREQNVQMQYRINGMEEKMQHMQTELTSLNDRRRTLELQFRLEKEQHRLEKEQHQLVKDELCRKYGSRNESDISENK